MGEPKIRILNLPVEPFGIRKAPSNGLRKNKDGIPITAYALTVDSHGLFSWRVHGTDGEGAISY